MYIIDACLRGLRNDPEYSGGCYRLGDLYLRSVNRTAVLDTI